MAKAIIHFEVNYCRDECPFCSFFKETNQWFCSALIGSPVNAPYAVISNIDTEPLKFCPYKVL